MKKNYQSPEFEYIKTEISGDIMSVSSEAEDGMEDEGWGDIWA